MTPRPTRVLFVQHYPDGGSVVSLLGLMRALDRDRFHPVVCFRSSNAYIVELEDAGITVEVLFPAGRPSSAAGPNAVLRRRGGRRGRSSPLRREVRRVLRRDVPATRRLLRVARRHRVDLIHANNDVLSNRDALLVGALLRRPVVAHVRSLHAYRPDLARCFDRLLARRVAWFHFVSQAVADNHMRHLPVPRGRWSVLDNPFAVDDFAPEPAPGLAAAFGISESARVVLHVGRIARWKGQDLFLRAFAAVAGAQPDAVALLVGAATDPDGRAFRDELADLATELGIADVTVFAGARRDVPQVLALADVVVHCSTAAEPFGRVIVEAMASGRPVVGADAGGAREIIEHGVTGLLVPPNEPEELAAAVAGLLRDPARAAALGRRARSSASARFSLEAHARAVEDVYDQVMRDASSTGAGRRRRAPGSGGSARRPGRWRPRR